jgi:thiamine pyrophosphokinase
MSKFVILLGGRLRRGPRLDARISGARFIAADSGMIHAGTLGVTPELWVGDFDSTSRDLANRHAGIEREEHPVEKAATDGELAIAAALARGASEIVLIGGFGGQADHMLGHLGLLLDLARRKVKAFMTSGNEEAHALLPGELALDLADGDRVSIIPFADLDGLDIANVRWPLAGRSVPLGSSLTLSNIALGPVRIALRSGYGVVIAYPRMEAA